MDKSIRGIVGRVIEECGCAEHDAATEALALATFADAVRSLEIEDEPTRAEIRYAAKQVTRMVIAKLIPALAASLAAEPLRSEPPPASEAA